MTEVTNRPRPQVNPEPAAESRPTKSVHELEAPLVEVIAGLFQEHDHRELFDAVDALTVSPTPAAPTARGSLRPRRPEPKTVRVDTERPKVTPEDHRTELATRGLTAPQRRAALETLWRSYRDAGPALREDQLIDAVREFMDRIDALAGDVRERLLIHAAALNAASVKDSSDQRSLRLLVSATLFGGRER